MTIIFEITWKHAAYTYIIWFEQHTKSGNLWPSDLKLHEKMLLNDTHIILFEQPTQSGNIQSHWPSNLKLHEKMLLMIPISSHLSNLPNQAIFRVMWLSDLKSHEKMLFNDTHIIPFEQPTQSGNIQSHVTTTLYICTTISL